MKCELDHLVIAAHSLEEGEAHAEVHLGVRPVRGGRHAAMGTHNALLRLGERSYIEIIAIDPDAEAPARPRWFALDEPRMRAAISEAPRLVHWVARCSDIAGAAAVSADDFGAVHAMARADLRWSITVPDDGALPGGGILPTLIEWPDARHPSLALPRVGLELLALAGEHPQAGRVRTILERLDLGRTMPVSFAGKPRMAAFIKSPRGIVTLGSSHRRDRF